uniref:Uncharacterized protein n=1 Tax=Salix viminalis TaxID=40686 RepID=A0A6N2N841_SALVM
MTGCVANLYESLEKLDESYLQPNQNKDSILKPIITTEATNPNFLLPNTKKPENQKLYYCRNHPGCVSDIQNSVCSQCRSQGYGTCYLNEEVNFAGKNDSTSTDTPTTDQGVSPMSMVSGVSLLNKFDIKDFGVLEEKVVQFGINECLELLKASLLSKDALTAVFLLKDKDGAPVENGPVSEYFTLLIAIILVFFNQRRRKSFSLEAPKNLVDILTRFLCLLRNSSLFGCHGNLHESSVKLTHRYQNKPRPQTKSPKFVS